MDTTHRNLHWCRLSENARFSKRHEEVREARKKISIADHDSSPVYRKSYKAPGPINAQRVQFRLRMPFVIIENESQSSPTGTWTGAESRNLLVSNSRKSIDYGQKFNPIQLMVKYGMFCINKIWMIRSRRKITPTTSTSSVKSIGSDSPTNSGSSPVNRISEHMYFESSASSTPLPIFLRRPLTETLLLRRPLIEKIVPLEVNDELFEVIANSIDLKALPFKKTAESFKFYETHFPLILTRVTKEGERCSTPSKRARTPDSPMTIMIQRQRLLNQRLVDLECMMIDMEHETEDCLFITELHDQVFDPTKWKWNKMDVGALRRRYTIDASLREM